MFLNKKNILFGSKETSKSFIKVKNAKEVMLNILKDEIQTSVFLKYNAENNARGHMTNTNTRKLKIRYRHC